MNGQKRSLQRARGLILVLLSVMLMTGTLRVGVLMATEEKRVALEGRIKTLAEDQKSFVLKTRGSSYKVTWGSRTKIFVHEMKKISELRNGTTLQLLAHKQPAAFAPGGGRYPEMYVRINAIIAATGYTPPRASTKLRQALIKWHIGKLKKKLKEYWIDKVQLMAGKELPVLVIKKGKSSAFARKQDLFVMGMVEGTGRKKTLKATEIIIRSMEYPAKSYPLVFDMKRKPKRPETKPDF